MCIKSKIVALFIALITTPAWAEDYVINVNGIVCEFCSFGVAKKVSKLSFIDQSKYNNGVKVEVEDQMVTIAVRPDQSINKDALFGAIESGGYNPVDIWRLTAEGERVEYHP